MNDEWIIDDGVSNVPRLGSPRITRIDANKNSSVRVHLRNWRVASGVLCGECRRCFCAMRMSIYGIMALAGSCTELHNTQLDYRRIGGKHGMEKPYMFFDTALAFCVAIFAVGACAIFSGVAILLLPEVWLLQFVAVLVICASILSVPFWLDYRLRKKRRGGGN